MIEVKIPKEIKEYQEKFVLGFPLRQSISILLSVGIGIFTFKMLENKISTDSITTIIALLIVPVILFGFIKYEDLHLEKYIYLYFRYLFVIPRNRKYAEYSVLDEISRESIVEYETAMRIYRKTKKKKIKAKQKGEV